MSDGISKHLLVMEQKNLNEWVDANADEMGPMVPSSLASGKRWKTMWDSDNDFSMGSMQSMVDYFDRLTAGKEINVRSVDGALAIELLIGGEHLSKRYVVVRTGEDRYRAYLSWSR